VPDPAPPLPIEVIQKRGTDVLRIRWTDGHESVTPLVEVRAACTCATCNERRNARAGTGAAPPLTAPPSIAADELKPVGSYGIQIHWSDGHHLGIYTWPYLRSLCRCAAGGGA
jgi:DUF971 family protein